MAKKKVKKEKKEVEPKEVRDICTSETEVARLDVIIDKLTKRIDRIVDAISRAKPVKNL